MRITQSLAYKNFAKRPGRSVGLIILAAFLAFSVFSGTLMMNSLAGGLDSLQDRLGADVMVVPYKAATHSNLENIILNGNTGYFYMDMSRYGKIAETEGIEKISPQVFLASTSSSCCSVPVQIIGFDPETDFTITPWIKKSHGGDIGDMEVVVGNDLNAFVGDTLTFFNTDVRVAGKLDKTGTTMDTTVYTNINTIKALIRSSIDMKMNTFNNIDPDRVVSCVMIKVADGYTAEDVMNYINIHVSQVKAVQTKNLISGVSDSLSGVSDIIRMFMIAVWILAVVIMIIAYTVSVNARKKEFAVLRVIGASRKKLSGIIMKEGLIINIIGGITGLAAGLAAMIPLANYIESELSLPYLLPGAGWIVLIAVLSVVCTAAAGALTCLVASRRITKTDTGLILREGN